MILLATDNRFGAISGILLLGGAFAPIYPLVVEKIGHRFPYYHPGLLQRHLFLRHRRRAAGALHAGLFRVAVGREGGDGLAAGRVRGGVRAAAADLAGSAAERGRASLTGSLNRAWPQIHADSRG